MAELARYEPLLQLLIDHHVVNATQVAEILEEQKRTGNPMQRIAIDLGIIREDDLLVLFSDADPGVQDLTMSHKCTLDTATAIC